MLQNTITEELWLEQWENFQGKKEKLQNHSGLAKGH